MSLTSESVFGPSGTLRRVRTFERVEKGLSSKVQGPTWEWFLVEGSSGFPSASSSLSHRKVLILLNRTYRGRVPLLPRFGVTVGFRKGDRTQGKVREEVHHL